MFKRIKWGDYRPLPSPAVDKTALAQLQKLVNLAFPNCNIDTQSPKAKNLLEYDVVTITDGNDEECYSIDRLVYHLLPYVLFSNNLWFVRSFKRSCGQVNALELLVRMVIRYHHTVKKNPNFHL